MAEDIISPERQQEKHASDSSYVDADATFMLNPRARPLPSFMQDEEDGEGDGDGEWCEEGDVGQDEQDVEQDGEDEEQDVQHGEENVQEDVQEPQWGKTSVVEHTVGTSFDGY